MKFGNIKICVISIYRSEFFSNSTNTLDYCSKFVDYHFLCGDLIIDYLDDNRISLFFKDILLCNGMNVKSMYPTRIFTNVNGHISSTNFNYIITDPNLSNCKVTIFEGHFNDHQAIPLNCFFQIDMKATTRAKKFKLSRNIIPAKLNYLVLEISNVCFEDVYPAPNVVFFSIV